MNKKQQAIFDLFKVIRDTAIIMDFDNKEKTVIDCEYYMEKLKPGSTKSSGFEGIFDDLMSGMEGRKRKNMEDIIKYADDHLKRDGKSPLASDYFKDM